LFRRAPPSPAGFRRSRSLLFPASAGERRLAPNGCSRHLPRIRPVRATSCATGSPQWYLHLFAPAQPETSTVRSPTCGSSTRTCALLFDRGSRVCASTRPRWLVKESRPTSRERPDGNRARHPFPTATRFTRSTAAGPIADSYGRARACSSASLDARRASASRATCAGRAGHRPSTSTSLLPPGSRARGAGRSPEAAPATRPSTRRPPLGASNHDGHAARPRATGATDTAFSLSSRARRQHSQPRPAARGATGRRPARDGAAGLDGTSTRARSSVRPESRHP